MKFIQVLSLKPLKHLRFESIGQVFDPKSISTKGTHASYPVALTKTARAVKVFFTRRNPKNQSYIVSMDFNWQNGLLICVDQEPKTVLQSDGKGFDKDGISMGNIIEINGHYHLYVLGWNLQTDVPWRNTIGLATSISIDGPFEQSDSNPIIPISEINPHSMSYPWVIEVGNEYHCYFGSNGIWGETLNEMDHVIKRATSLDGITWKAQPETVIPIDKEITAVSRPTVARLEAGFIMLYSGKDAHGFYDIYAAHSNDGKEWNRCEMDIIGKRGLWESAERSYPAIFVNSDDIYVLYNGNGYGATGFGLLKLTK